jgi:septal ring factor EnvC (AmiA/AmiB activator)
MIPIHSKLANTVAVLAVAALPAMFAAPALAQSMGAAVNAQVETDKAAAASQNRINEIRERTQDAASRYAQAVADTESLEKYNAQLDKQVKSQNEEMNSIERQLLDIETTNREVQPLMQQMVNTLQKFVALDVPFLLDERTKRVQNLQDIMARADVTISEKYRLILEAYQIELEYGRTLEAYEGRVGEGDATKIVEFVRLGRISLMYQTLDGKETGYWDANAKQWVVDNDYAHAVAEARRVAKKDGAPDLLTVPVPAPQGVRS